MNRKILSLFVLVAMLLGVVAVTPTSQVAADGFSCNITTDTVTYFQNWRYYTENWVRIDLVRLTIFGNSSDTVWEYRGYNIEGGYEVLESMVVHTDNCQGLSGAWNNEGAYCLTSESESLQVTILDEAHIQDFFQVGDTQLVDVDVIWFLIFPIGVEKEFNTPFVYAEYDGELGRVDYHYRFDANCWWPGAIGTTGLRRVGEPPVFGGQDLNIYLLNSYNGDLDPWSFDRNLAVEQLVAVTPLSSVYSDIDFVVSPGVFPSRWDMTVRLDGMFNGDAGVASGVSQIFTMYVGDSDVPVIILGLLAQGSGYHQALPVRLAYDTVNLFVDPLTNTPDAFVD